MRLIIAMTLSVWMALSISACSSLVKTRAELLRDEVSRFNDNVRWGRYRVAAKQLPVERRDIWIASMERAGRAFRILDYEVRPQIVQDELAVILVDMVYHPANDVIIRRVRRRQVWKKVGTWYLESEHQLTPQQMPPPDMFPEFGDAPRSASAAPAGSAPSF